jgi:flagellar basal-body rod protein FlgB
MSTLGLLEKALNIRAFYQKVLASNIANVETPGYSEKKIDFQAELDRSGNGDASSVRVTENDPPDGAGSLDGNTVNVEEQVVKMTENSLMYNALVQLISKKFSMMKYVISGGGQS